MLELMDNQNLTRREFLKWGSSFGILLGGTTIALSNSIPLSYLLGTVRKSTDVLDYLDELKKSAPLARFWTSTSLSEKKCETCHISDDISPDMDYDHGENILKCLLCAQGCTIKEDERGKCRTRINLNGELRTLVYGRPISIHIDPIEKKPLFHFLPGSQAFSLSTSGCPLSCKFCQNWQISQAKPEDYPVQFTPPKRIVNSTLSRNVPVIAFTYNEPTVSTEYLLDIANLAKKQNLRSVIISCGFMNSEPLTEMCECLDAIKIDLKGFSEDFYRTICQAELKPVLRSIKQVSRCNTHLEIVNLVVPTLNDSEEMLSKLAEWIAGEVGPDVPIHFTRFHPDYKLLNLPPTPIATLELARNIAMDKGIHYVFVGNVPGHPGNNTFCPSCNQVLIKRTGFFILEIHLNNGKCKYCNFPIAGIWN